MDGMAFSFQEGLCVGFAEAADQGPNALGDLHNRQRYQGEPGDDTTVAAVRIRERTPVNLLMGPPADPRDATKMMTLFFSKEGKKIVCGGTTSQIAADYLHETIVTSLDYGTDPAIPPVGHMKGVDLVTEGVITMSRVVEYAKAFVEGTDLTNLWSVQTDGASQIAQLLFEYATDINFFIGNTETVVVPAIAVLKLQGANDRYVFINKDGKAKRVSVNLGKRFEDKIELISDEIQEGDELIVVGQGRVIDGSPITITQ